MKVRIAPMIERNEDGKVSVPSSFTVLENDQERVVRWDDHNLRDILYNMREGSITPTTIKNREFFQSISDPIL